jgi:hypothetical protein
MRPTAIRTINLPQPYVVDDLLPRRHFPLAGIAQGTDIHDQFVEAFQRHFGITDSFREGRVLDDVCPVVFLDVVEALHHGLGKTCAAQAVFHDFRAVIDQVVRDHHPVVGVARLVAEVDSFPGEYLAHEQELFFDQALPGYALEKRGQPLVLEHASVEIRQHLGEQFALAQRRPQFGVGRRVLGPFPGRRWGRGWFFRGTRPGAQVAQGEGVAVDSVRHCAVLDGKLFAVIHHFGQASQEYMPAVQVAVARQRDFVHAPGQRALRRGLGSRDAFVIVKIGVLFLHLAEPGAQIKAVGVAPAVVEVDFALVQVVQRIAHDAVERGDAGAGGGHQQRVAARFVAVIAFAARPLDVQLTACLQFVQQPVAHEAAALAQHMEFKEIILLGQAGERVAADQAVGAAQVDELPGVVRHAGCRFEEQFAHIRRKHFLAVHHGGRIQVGGRRDFHVPHGNALAGHEIAVVAQFAAQPFLRDVGNGAFHAALQADVANAVAAGEGYGDALSLECVQDGFPFARMYLAAFVFQGGHGYDRLHLIKPEKHISHG